MSTQAKEDRSAADFGANEWMVEELYEKYLQDKNSVDPAWWDFFADFLPPGSADVPSSDVTAGTVDPLPEGQGTRGEQAPAHAPAAEAADAPRTRTTTAAAHREREEQHTPYLRSDLPPAPPVAAIPARTFYATLLDEERADVDAQDVTEKLKGVPARLAKNMDESLTIPVATSVRAVPAKVMVENRMVINRQLARTRGGKVSFTHLIGYATVEALREMPEMNWSYKEVDGKPHVFKPAHVNFGIAIDLPKPDGTRQLVVPSINAAEQMNFAQFLLAYQDLVRRARNGKLTLEDYATTVSLTNPGGIGTVHSIPRLMNGQGLIVGVGAMDYPAEFAGASDQTLARMAVSKVTTLTSTYDHRVIQGATSGEFLKLVEAKLLGTDDFYHRVYESLGMPYHPVSWQRDHEPDPETELGKPARIAELIHAYRSRGHLISSVDPLSVRRQLFPDLSIAGYGLTLWDNDRYFPTGGFGGTDRMTLRDLIAQLRETYCSSVGVEYMHIQDPAQRRWFQDRIERPVPKFSQDDQLQILRKLNEAEAFETFLQTKYVGQKRFSLEGGESLIPLLDQILQGAADDGLEEVAIAMAHRGRLNVLTNIAGKSYSQVFNEFEGNQDPSSVQGSGDVKYHLGTVGTYSGPDGQQTGVYLAANPSHLEAAGGVLEGIVRAKQDRIGLGDAGYPVLPILIHGDAAFAGQGVVWETLNMSQLRGYRTGGTIHLIVNNQIGFTTSPANDRSSYYATDMVKGLQLPVFHVNGDDPEAVARVARLAYEYRQEFAKDVAVDLVCYRRRGHNEGDDPSMTQPVMYSFIERHRSTRKLYTEALVGRGDITADQAAEALKEYQGILEEAFEETREGQTTAVGLEQPETQDEDAGTMVGWSTAVEPSVLTRAGEAHTRLPQGFTAHPKIMQLAERRAAMATDGGIDWGMGELLAFGSLLMEGTPVRLAGQDSRRGTFVQRHAVFHDHRNGNEFTPLNYLTEDQAPFDVYDSPLSEYAPLAFEYGYSVERPDALVLWEAQFGDFANGAQPVIDEFISSAEQKWNQSSSVVLLLPHGYEGQGPDHSSARIERYLQLAAEDNMVICQPSTPANHFHMLRRQAYARPRKPLIVFTPKQLLRLRAAQSSVEDFTKGTFRTVIAEQEKQVRDNAANVERVLLCSGRLYYDLAAERLKRKDDKVAIIRIEQLYPLDQWSVAQALKPYQNAELLWVQDEPANQGPWTFVSDHLESETLGGRELRLVSRAAAASPSTGLAKIHKVQAGELLGAAFDR